MLNTKQADKLLDNLGDGGMEGRIKKSVRRFRNDPSRENEAKALKMVSHLSKEKQRALRSVL